MMTFCSMLLGSHRKMDYHPLFRNIVFKESCCHLIGFSSNSFRSFSPTNHLTQTFYSSLIHCPLHNFSFAFPSTFLKGSTKNQRLAKWAFVSSEGEHRAGAYYKGQLQTSQIKNFIEHNAVMFVVHYNSTPYPNLNPFPPTNEMISYFRFVLLILIFISNEYFPFLICSSMFLINFTYLQISILIVVLSCKMLASPPILETLKVLCVFLFQHQPVNKKITQKNQAQNIFLSHPFQLDSE